jgi:hypothetical protein
MIGVPALALAVTFGGADYDAALARAARYTHDQAANMFYGKLSPLIVPALGKQIMLCSVQEKYSGYSSAVVVFSYKDGAPDRILIDKDTRFGRCVAEGAAKIELPAGAPYPDYAVRMGAHHEVGRQP